MRPLTSFVLGWVLVMALAGCADHDDSSTPLIPTPYIDLTRPNGGETWAIGANEAIVWTGNLGGSVRVELDRGYPSGTWESITDSTVNDGTHPWIVSGNPTSVARVRVVSREHPSVGDTSAADFSLATASGANRVYVTQTSDESLGLVNLVTGTVNLHVLDLGLYCNEIIKYGRKLYVANSGTNSIQEIDAETNQTLRTIDVGNGCSPWSMAILNPDTMAVTCFGSRKLAFFDLSSGSPIGEMTMETGPEGLLAHQGRLYVCETGVDYPTFSSGRVRVYEAATWQLLDTLVVGVNAQFAAIDTLERLHVVCTGNFADVAGAIYVIDLETLSVDQILPVGGSPNAISFGGGYAFVAAGGFGGPGLVFRYRLSDLSIINDAANPLLTSGGAMDVEAMTDGSFFVSCFEADEVRYHDANGVLIHTYLVSDGPAYLVTFP